jgi:hypothetical protein
VASYITFDTADAGGLLIEVDPEEMAAPEGTIKAGLKDTVRDAVMSAQVSLEHALTRVVQANARLFIEAVRSLEQRPAEMEMSFGVKATGEVGNLAIAKAGGEANYTIRLVWREAEQ